jgi:hypothetical protein
MVVHELKNDVSTVRIHDEFCEADSTRLIGSVSRVVSASYKRRYLSKPQEPSVVVSISEHQPKIATLQA